MARLKRSFVPCESVRGFVTWLGTATRREVIVTMETTDHSTVPALLRWRPHGRDIRSSWRLCQLEIAVTPGPPTTPRSGSTSWRTPPAPSR